MPYDRTKYVTRTPMERVVFDFYASQDQFLFPKLFDPKPVQKAVTKVPQYDTSKIRVPQTKKGTDARPNLIDEQLFYRSLDLVEYKLASEINPRNVRDADRPELISDARKARIVSLGLMLQTEQEAVTLATTAGNYVSSLTSALSAGDRWDDNGDIEAHMVTANAALRASCGQNANALAIGIDTYEKIRLGANLRARTQYTNGGPIPDEMIKAYFKVQHLFVGSAQRDTANEGATKAVGGFWGANAIAFVYKPSFEEETVGFGAQWQFGSPFWTKTITDENRSGAAGSMRQVQVGTEYMLASGYVESEASSKFAAGYLFRTAVS